MTSTVELDQKNVTNTSTSKFTFTDQRSHKKLGSAIQFRADASVSNPNSARMRKKKMEGNEIYKGMPYEEWTKIRDQFLKTHNMQWMEIIANDYFYYVKRIFFLSFSLF